MAYNMNIGFGFRRLLDQNLRVIRAGQPLYLRVKNFDPTEQPFEDLGMTFTVTASGALSGTTDILIQPQPSIKQKPMTLVQDLGPQLRKISALILVSHTFVEARQKLMGYVKPQQVFNDPSVVCLLNETYVYNIESFDHEDIGGTIITWHLSCSGNEIK